MPSFTDRFASARARVVSPALLALVVAGCSSAEPASSASEPEPQPAEASEPLRAGLSLQDGPPELPPLREPPRGLGSMSARIPGTSDVVGGVHLAAHRARVTLAQGVAHTEVEEEFRNDTDRVLEGRLVFPIPAGATLGRLALWVGSTLVEGEVVERARADRIFRGIVDDTVRPRDPALLDVVSGGTLSLRIFPIPAKGSRKVVFEYDEVIRRHGGALRHVHRLSFGADRPTPVDVVTVMVDGETRLDLRDASAVDDVVTVVDEAPPALVVGSTGPSGSPADAGDSAVIVRQIAQGSPDARPFAGDVVVALDVSSGQSEASLAAQVHLADAVLARLLPDETFALLACDTACASYPPEGRAASTSEELAAARRFLAGLEAAGASDPAGALEEAARRLELLRPGQVLLLSDGVATAGELSVASQLAHAAPLLAGADVRVVGVGRAVDDRSLGALARGLGATYDRLADGAPLAERIGELAQARRAPVVRRPRVDLPAGVAEPEPVEPLPTRAGDEVVVMARATTELAGSEGAVVATSAPVPRLWARERIAELEAQGDEADARITALAIRHHVLSRTTSLLVLESDRMFAEFGIPRTTVRAEPEGASGLGAEDGASLGVHRTRPPMIRMGSTSVSGRLPPEAVQRIVRQNFGRVRGCYVQGLVRDPTLAGRVTVRFVIDRSGAVSTVADGGSDLPDPRVVACVVAAFSELSFPQPEGGIVHVVYPIVLSPVAPAEGPEARAATLRVPPTGHHDVSPLLPTNSALNPPPWVPPPVVPPSVVHRPGDDGWLASTSSAAQLTRLAARVERDPSRRRAHVELVRALLVAGRFEAAHRAAATLVDLDPDLPAAREMLADTAAVLGRAAEAASATAAAASLDPRSPSRQLAAARAASASGDRRRACAHLRALGELSPREHAARGAECREGRAPTLPGAAPGGFEVRTSCAPAACPAVVVIDPGGRVLSPWTSGPGPDVMAGPLRAGTYRTLVVGGIRAGEITVRALGSSFVARLAPEQDLVTAVMSRVTIPPAPRRVVVRM